MQMKRAYSQFTIKAADDEAREIRGLATTPTTDRMGDIVLSKGAKFTLPLPLLWQHKHDQPIGHVISATVTDAGIEIVAAMVKDVTGTLATRLDEAWEMIKVGLVRGLSIGFTPIKYAYLDTGGIEFSEWDWHELSAVTIPANTEASIATIKSIDTKALAAFGSRASLARVRATPITKNKGAVMKTIAEQLAGYEETRKEKSVEMADIMAKAGEDGVTLDVEQADAYDALADECAALKKHIERLQSLQAQDKASARSAQAAPTGAIADLGTGREPVRVKNTQKLAPGIAFARAAKCVALGYLEHRSAIDIAKSRYGDNDVIVATTDQLVTKSAVAPATTANASWAGALVGDVNSAFADFVEFLRPQTVIGKFGTSGIPALRTVPFRTPLVGQTSGGDGYWVGEGKPKGLTKFDFARTTLDPMKVANIAVATMEVVRDSSPSADVIIRDQLAAALRSRMDKDFIDPTNAGSLSVKPASILNGATNTPSSGNSSADIRADVKAVFGAFIANNNAPTSGVWVMSATIALALSLMENPLGQEEFKGITMLGGTFAGLPVIVSEYAATNSFGSTVALINAGDVYLADEGGIDVSMSSEASLQMDDSPSEGAQAMVSLWQNNLLGFRAERTINWARRRDSAVVYLTAVNWGS